MNQNDKQRQPTKFNETVRQRALGHLRGKNYHVEVEEGINWTVTPEA
ncbi:uncharacterized protein ACA1_363150 [Acanthamoeba castellanii str. Neff]|uniref:Uncharacterized protein n=1 Tax=Acanthamoeba castellanii (strain ATCC 30010 / Neff) TaxID=1257118 RepID=L8GFN8_ACACF|nr:uncharacterized protein ACA1_363150 [Acanthamoeba castellanii str. Neff]ELR11817.1 hypothetical protein ACA1_363150 [Acanthamoeba castellanii str. Neff]